MATELPPPPPPELPPDPPDFDSTPTKRQAKPHATLFRLGLQPLIINFKSTGFIDQARLESYDARILKKAVSDTAREVDVRTELGIDSNTWKDLADLVDAAVPSLSDRCFKPEHIDDNGNNVDYNDTVDAASAREIAKNYNTLMKDLMRLNMLCSIARNILTVGESAQTAAVEAKFDKSLFELIRLCVRVTARPYGSVYDSATNGDANGKSANSVDAAKTDEDKFNSVATEYKTLLTRSLQVVNNLVAQNERRKLMLWVELFDERGADGVIDKEIDAVSRFVPARKELDADDIAKVTQAFGNVLKASKKIADAHRGEGDQPLALEGWDDEHAQADKRPQDGLLAVPEEDRVDTGSENGARNVSRGRKRVKSPRGNSSAAQEAKSPAKAEENPPRTKEEEEVFRDSPFLQWLDANLPRLAREYATTGNFNIPYDFDDERRGRLRFTSPNDALWWKMYEKAIKPVSKTLPPSNDEAEGQKKQEQSTSKSASRRRKKKTPSIAPPEHEAADHQLSVELQGLKITKDFDSSDPAYKHFAPTWSSQAVKEDETLNDYVVERSKPILPEAATEEDFRPTYSAAQGANILEKGKADLLKRLEPDKTSSQRGRQPERQRTMSDASVPHSHANTEQYSATIPSDAVEPAVSEEESEEDDFPAPGDDGRGLLTDIPLILGPGEIEVLPMIIQSSICPPAPGTPGYGKTPQEVAAVKNMHTVRCHLLLAQDNGRNLLRELLIFVAAWDLREDELFFKLMVKIMEAILLNGLMPFAYRAFRESKDIISPAQAVVLKLLTSIFRRRQAAHSPRRAAQKDGSQEHSSDPYPQRVDVQTVSFLLTEFRRTIIPQTCVLIFLQGKIRDGTVSPEDFPLNLWDMERMYEGVYQFLEFFAILTEHEGWKDMMADWEVVSELITLLEELDGAIPRSTPAGLATQQQQKDILQKQGEALREAAAKGKEKWESITQQAATQPPQTAPQPVSVERPYDVNTSPILPPPPPDQSTEQIPLPPPSTLAEPPPPPPPPEDEPSDFEWRNLKKLAVLVLSSLTWKSKRIQQQLNAADASGLPGRGLRVLLGCCAADDFNPFIREHGIMALRFALEGNEAGMKIVKDLVGERADAGERVREGVRNVVAAGRAAIAAGGSGAGASQPSGGSASGANGGSEDEFIAMATQAMGKGKERIEVPKEVLDLRGYETFVDGKGQVQLRRKEKK